MIDKSYKCQDGRHNCKFNLKIYTYGSTELYCHIDESFVPIITGIFIEGDRSPHDELTDHLFDDVLFSGNNYWDTHILEDDEYGHLKYNYESLKFEAADTWTKEHAVSEFGICDKFERKEVLNGL